MLRLESLLALSLLFTTEATSEARSPSLGFALARCNHVYRHGGRLLASADQAREFGNGHGKRPKRDLSIDESLDVIDDIVMERPPAIGRDKVKVFGAWLDADVAGRKAGKGNRAEGLLKRAKEGETLTVEEKAEVFYEEAIVHMGKGNYETALEMLTRAVSYAGEDSRRGGEFKLWAAQALQAAGRNAQAVDLLKSMKYHRDRDVRLVSNELLYIAQAPQLKLNEKDYVEFPDVSHIDEAFDKDMWKELSKPKASYAKDYKAKKEEYVVRTLGRAPENDYVMLGTCLTTVLVLSAYFLL
ncbi:unnamed protein product [Choristocarpus tenellus]